MKKVAVTVAVLALGLAACAKNNTNNVAANDMYAENNTAADMNAATPENVAQNALENASSSIDNAQAAVSNMADNTTTNK